MRALKAKGVALRATEQPIDTSTAAGKAFLDMLGVFAEFETNLRKERQMEGIAKAKAAGVYKGVLHRLIPRRGNGSRLKVGTISDRSQARHWSCICLSGFRGSLTLTRGLQIQHLWYVRQFQRVLPVAIETSKPSAAGFHQRPPHGSVALETPRRRRVSNNHDAHPELGGSTRLSVTDRSRSRVGDGSSLAPTWCRARGKSN